jgi:hypothetical protein
MYEGKDYQPEKELEILIQDLQKAEAQNLKAAPGVHAYIGYLYSAAGNSVAARDAFTTEKTLYPEAAVFMDRLLANLNRSAK